MSALPTSYTDSAIIEYMRSIVAGIGPADDWTDYQEQLNDILIMYGGITSISGATDIEKLRAIAKVSIWSRLARATSGMFDFSADGGSYKRSQMHDFIVGELAKAESEAAEFVDSPEHTIRLGKMEFDDYYTPTAGTA